MGFAIGLRDRMNIPEPYVEQHRARFRLVWIVPMVAAAVGILLLINHWRESGPRVSIIFESGEGLEVGKTLLKYRDVTIGRVSEIKLNRERTQVEVLADLTREASDLATEGTHFWVVRPRVGVGWATGLDTLLSGAYIGVESGPPGKASLHFQGLEAPPPLPHRAAGRRVVLQAAELGSVSVGAPVYFHRFQVGQVLDEYLDATGNTARIAIFVDAPHDRNVNQGTRFWNASGIDISLSAEGLKVRSQSLLSVVAGGVAFEEGPDVPDVNLEGSDAQYVLYKDKTSASAPPDGNPRIVRMRFDKPLRGLVVGAPIEFVGVEIGNVMAIDVGYEPSTRHFPVFVTGRLYPRRMGLSYTGLLTQGKSDTDDDLAQLSQQLVASGLRVRPHSGSLLTGRLYLAMEFVRDAPKASFNLAARPVELPTLDSNIDEIQEGVAKIIKKIDALPLQTVVAHADEDLKDLHGTLGRLNDTLLPTATQTLNTMQETLRGVEVTLADDSPLRGDVHDTLDALQGTLRSVRTLADTLNRHPEALIKGRATDSPTPSRAQRDPDR